MPGQVVVTLYPKYHKFHKSVWIRGMARIFNIFQVFYFHIDKKHRIIFSSAKRVHPDACNIYLQACLKID
jgi:hypothetical protein